MSERTRKPRDVREPVLPNDTYAFRRRRRGRIREKDTIVNLGGDRIRHHERAKRRGNDHVGDVGDGPQMTAALRIVDSFFGSSHAGRGEGGR